MTTSQQIFRRRVRRLILVPLAVSLLIATVLELQVRRLTSAQGWVDHSDIVLARSRQLLKTIIDQETGLRGYTISHDERFLQPYHVAERSLPAFFDEFRTDITDNAERQAQLESVRQSYERWHDYSRKAIALVQRRDPAADSVEFNLTGKQLMDEVRARQQELVDHEEQLREVRLQHSRNQGRTLTWTLLGLLVVLALTLLNETRSNLHAVNTEYADILEDLRKRSAELSESRERLEVTLRSIGDAVIVTDAEGKVTFLNRVAEQLTQYPLKNALGLHLDDVFRIVNEETRKTVESPFAKVMRIGGIVGLANHTILLRADGTEIAIDDSGAPIRDDEGKIFGVVLVFRDVTQQKEILNTLRTNEKLAAAGKLSASIAHEIHNPLETVRNLFFLIRKNASAELQNLLNMAEQELTRVVQITTNMLSLYRESKKLIPLKLGEVVESVEVLLQRAIRDKQIALSKEIRTDTQIAGFPAEMRQVISNLVSNAIDAVQPGGQIRITVENTKTKDFRTAVAVVVRDNGSGIPENVKDKLFQPFFTTKGENGTGLGLWITQGIVSKHGGYIEVTSDGSNGDHGTTFRVVFPKLGTEIAS
jgi:PAS domain S-box-containing protein